MNASEILTNWINISHSQGKTYEKMKFWDARDVVEGTISGTSDAAKLAMEFMQSAIDCPQKDIVIEAMCIAMDQDKRIEASVEEPESESKPDQENLELELY